MRKQARGYCTIKKLYEISNIKQNFLIIHQKMLQIMQNELNFTLFRLRKHKLKQKVKKKHVPKKVQIYKL